MDTSDPNSEKESKETEYRKVIVNIPKPLLDTLDLVCGMKFYTRKEAIKQSMRDFIKTEMGEDWTSPVMVEYEKKLVSDAMVGLAEGLAQASQSTIVKKAQQEQQAQQRYPPL